VELKPLSLRLSVGLLQLRRSLHPTFRGNLSALVALSGFTDAYLLRHHIHTMYPLRVLVV
jgi:hypothetical protein